MMPRRICSVAGVLTAVVLSVACSASSSTSPSSLDAPVPASTDSSPAPSQSAANFEIKFMQNMIDHHQMAVEMAEICLTNAVHEELRSVCSDIIATQSAEIRQMQRWLQRWYDISYTPTMKSGDERMLERLASLSGAEFEMMFMEMMIRHHETAISAAESCVDKAPHGELVALCENIIATQSVEIEQFRAWLCQWYGQCQ